MLRIAFVSFMEEWKDYASAIARPINGLIVTTSKNADLLVVDGPLCRFFPGDDRRFVTFVGVKGQPLADFISDANTFSDFGFGVWVHLWPSTGSQLRKRLEEMAKHFA